MAGTGRVVTLRDERNGTDRRLLRAYLDEEGALYIDGHDFGPGTATVSDDGEHEWSRRIAPEDVPRLLEALGGSPGEDLLGLLAERYRGKGSYELERVLRSSVVPVRLFVT